MKPPSTTVIGPNQPIVLAKNSNKIDWEGELAFVIGKGGKYITESQAYEHVAGYTCFNDVSEREIANAVRAAVLALRLTSRVRSPSAPWVRRQMKLPSVSL